MIVRRVQKTRALRFNLTVTCGAVVVLTGCGTALDPAYVHFAKAAPYKAAMVWEPTAERPSREAIESVQSIGRERFLRKMRELLPLPIAIHAIGWFGDIWDLHVIAPSLQSKDGDTRRVAVTAFSRLSGESFADDSDALAWWEENRPAIPEPLDVAPRR